jgi:hypothetical protein
VQRPIDCLRFMGVTFEFLAFGHIVRVCVETGTLTREEAWLRGVPKGAVREGHVVHDATLAAVLHLEFCATFNRCRPRGRRGR